jgi:hypothetical protein
VTDHDDGRGGRAPRWSGEGVALRAVLGRIDGALDVHDLAALTGLSDDVVEKALAPLVAAGMLVVGPSASQAEAGAPSTLVPPGFGDVPRTSSGEMIAPSGNALLPLSEDEQRRITDLYARLNKLDYYRLLGVPATADVKLLKRAFFALAKVHHPDRYYRRDVGALRPKIEAIFTALTTALETLSSPADRATYDAYLSDVLRTRMQRRSAESLERAGDWANASIAWGRVVQALPTDAYVQHREANALLRAHAEPERTVAAALRAVEIDGTRAEYRLTAACALLAVGRERSALAELETACEIEPDRVEWAALASAVRLRVAALRA